VISRQSWEANYKAEVQGCLALEMLFYEFNKMELQGSRMPWATNLHDSGEPLDKVFAHEVSVIFPHTTATGQLMLICFIATFEGLG